MKESLRQQQNIAQQQTLTPQQVQFVRLLEMNAPAIEDEVRNRLDENPALEAIADPEPQYSESADDMADADWNDDDRPERPARQNSAAISAAEMLENDPDVITLTDSLRRQLAQRPGLDERTRALAEYIIGNLDDNGWLTRSLAQIADDITIATGHEITRADLRPAFDAVRSLDPAGIAAVDLRDCLLLQLRRRPSSPAVRTATAIVDKYFDDFAAGSYQSLRKRPDVDASQFDAALDVIRTLNPKPGGNDSTTAASEKALQISPDFYVEPDENDPRRFNIALGQRLPELTLAESYRPENYEHHAGSERFIRERAFIRNRAQEATDFMAVLRRRTTTLMQVMKAIVDIQQDFFRTEDPADIRAMVLRDIGARTGLDLSVISRATSGKYVATPGGVYPLKMFFNEAPTADADVSQHSIFSALRALVDAEDKHAPLSDEALTAALNARGMPIARRTVVKYREQLKIPNSRARRAPR